MHTAEVLFFRFADCVRTDRQRRWQKPSYNFMQNLLFCFFRTK